ncbi:MAG: hypothetical protein WC360_01020 [Opitutales bacterium]
MHLHAVVFGSTSGDFASVESVSFGGTLPNLSASDWWYGCLPTSAGMMMAYYDTNGYKGFSYGNLVPGGTVGYSNVGAWPNGHLLRSVIASEGHQRDYYNAATYGYNTGGDYGFGYMEDNDDLASPTHTFDCLADFMGTSQDGYGIINGGTFVEFKDDGSRYYASAQINDGFSISGAAGLEAYVNFAGYGVASCFTQRSDIYLSSSTGGGFTFDDYAAEIAAGRPVIILYENPRIGGHAMLGVGVDEDAQLIEFLNTWDDELNTIAWDGDFYGLSLIGVIGMELATVPEPATTAAGLGVIVIAVAMYRRARRKTRNYRVAA